MLSFFMDKYVFFLSLVRIFIFEVFLQILCFLQISLVFLFLWEVGPHWLFFPGQRCSSDNPGSLICVVRLGTKILRNSVTWVGLSAPSATVRDLSWGLLQGLSLGQVSFPGEDFYNLLLRKMVSLQGSG